MKRNPLLSKITKVKIIEAWNCGIPEHTHIVKRAAESCLKKQNRQSAEQIHQAAIRRYLLAIKLHYGGAKLKEIGNKLGVGVERARQIVCKGKRIFNLSFKPVTEAEAFLNEQRLTQLMETFEEVERAAPDSVLTQPPPSHAE